MPENGKVDLEEGRSKKWKVLMFYLMKCVLEQKCKKLHYRKLGVRLDSSQVNTHEEPQKVSKLLDVAK